MADGCKYLSECLNGEVKACYASPETCDIYKWRESKQPNFTEKIMDKQYQTSKEDCAKQISGVCPGCGGELEPIETVDNSNQPTFWVGCMHCQKFCCGVDKHIQKLARSIVEGGYLSQCNYKSRHEYEDTPERLEYWKDTETSHMTQVILHIFAEDKKMREQPMANTLQERMVEVIGDSICATLRVRRYVAAEIIKLLEAEDKTLALIASDADIPLWVAMQCADYGKKATMAEVEKAIGNNEPIISRNGDETENVENHLRVIRNSVRNYIRHNLLGEK